MPKTPPPNCHPERPRRDTELTLGSGALLAMFFGLVLICGLCFGLGYAVGHHTSGPAAVATQTAAQSAAPDQEPLQGNSSIPKPSASAQAAVPPTSDSAQNPETDASANPETTQQSPAHRRARNREPRRRRSGLPCLPRQALRSRSRRPVCILPCPRFR